MLNKILIVLLGLSLFLNANDKVIIEEDEDTGLVTLCFYNLVFISDQNSSTPYTQVMSTIGKPMTCDELKKLKSDR